MVSTTLERSTCLRRTRIAHPSSALLRLAVCSLRGLDLEGCAALVVLIAMASSLVNTWSRFS